MTAAKHSVLLAQDGSNLWRALASLAIPSIISGWLKTAFLVVDTYFAGQINTVALGALSAATFFVWMFFSFSAMNSIGVMSQVSQAMGRRDDEAVVAIIKKGLSSAVVPGLLVSAGLIVVSRTALGFLGLPEDVQQGVADYLLYLALLGPFLWFFDTMDAALRGMGDAKTPLVLLCVFVGFNVLLNGIFAMGWFGFPALGIAGIALATGVAWFMGCFAMLIIFWRRGLFRPSKANPPRAWQLWRIGLPITLSGVFFDLIWLVLTPWVAQDGAAALAAVSIGHRLEAYGYMTSVGFGMATAALVGQAVGMQNATLAHRVAGMAARWAFGFNVIWIIVLLSFPAFFFGLFTDDVQVWHFGLAYLSLAAIGTPFQAWDIIYNDAFAGSGRTVFPMVIDIVGYACRIPLAWVLMAFWGAAGVFGAIGVSAAITGVVLPLAFHRWGTHLGKGQGVVSPTVHHP
ncbi:MAG: hypothetical protein CMH56_05505 [Myxococcales bacterium]|nr:hypothetical protein [Myxococcales bacterium]